MMRGMAHRSCQKGFTLVEVIVALTVAGVAFAMMVQFFGSYMTDSSEPVRKLNASMSLKQVAERIYEDYNQNPTADLNLIRNKLTSTPEVYGSGYTVIENRFIRFSNFRDYNETYTSGSGTQHYYSQRLLKVRIQHATTNEILTFLFVNPS